MYIVTKYLVIKSTYFLNEEINMNNVSNTTNHSVHHLIGFNERQAPLPWSSS